VQQPGDGTPGTAPGEPPTVAGFTAPSSAAAADRAAAPGAAAPGAAAPGAAAAEAAPDVESLPIPDYDELSASQVIERLEGLDADSLDAIRAYESSHRGRNTILGKIAQLR
jgi:hypothetical protein